MTATTRWTAMVDTQVDIELRTFLAQRGMKKGDLSKFIEESVKWRLFDLTLAEVRSEVESVPDAQLATIIDDAVAWTRQTPAVR